LAGLRASRDDFLVWGGSRNRSRDWNLEFGGRVLEGGLAAAGCDAVHLAAFGAMAGGTNRPGRCDVTAAEAQEPFLPGLAKHRTEFVIKDTVGTAHRDFRHLQKTLLALSAAVSNEYF